MVPPPGGGKGFANGRTQRYDALWGLYWNTAYDNLATYMRTQPVGSKLYKYTRGLRNPVARWADFYVANIWGGPLDNAAGDGSKVPSALPIESENEALRPALARLWLWSNWSSKRNLATRYSTTLGDLFIKVVDRPDVERIYMQALWPGAVKDVLWDDFGNIKLLITEYDKRDERSILHTASSSNSSETAKTYRYREVMEHPRMWGGNTTRVSTYRDGALFGYPENDNQPVWELPYDFVPAVHVPWVDVGMDWGAVGYAPVLRKIDGANAAASLLADQIAKLVNTPLVAYGIQAGDITVQASPEGIPITYVSKPPTEAKIERMIADLNLEDGLGLLNAQLDEIGDDLPELRMAQALRSGMSGEALGRAFADVMAKVQAVRAAHDSALVRAQTMAVAIAGESRYHKDFSGFNLQTYNAGGLDHNIGDRPVLPPSQYEEDQARLVLWQAVEAATRAGMPLTTALREVAGWSQEQIAAYTTEQQAADAVEQERAEAEAERAQALTSERTAQTMAEKPVEKTPF
jgi:hypothetical protein